MINFQLLTFQRIDEKIGKLSAKLIHRDFTLRRKPLHAPVQGAENGPGCRLHVAFAKHALLDAAFDNETVNLFVAVSLFDYLSKERRGKRSEIRVRRGAGEFFEDGSYVTHNHGSELFVGVQLRFCDCRSLIDEPAK